MISNCPMSHRFIGNLNSVWFLFCLAALSLKIRRFFVVLDDVVMNVRMNTLFLVTCLPVLRGTHVFCLCMFSCRVWKKHLHKGCGRMLNISWTGICSKDKFCIQWNHNPTLCYRSCYPWQFSVHCRISGSFFVR